MKCTQNSAGRTEATLSAGQLRKGTAVVGKYVCSTTDRSSLQSDQPHISRVTKVVSTRGVGNGRGVKLTTRLYLAPRV